MKKILIVFLFLCCFVLVGCDKGTRVNEKGETVRTSGILNCSKSTEKPVHFVTEMIYKFKNDKIVDLGVKYTYDLSTYTEEQRKGFAGAKMCDNESIKNTLGMKDCKEKLDGTIYTVEGTASKLLEQSSGTYEQVKKSYLTGGWTCKEQ